MWSWNEVSGHVMDKEAYNAIVHTFTHYSSRWRREELWKWHLRLKVKCFTWLMLENKIMTWDNVVKRGGVVLNICGLCTEGDKSVDHLLVSYYFTKQVWWQVTRAFNISQDWGGPNIISCFDRWIRRESNWKELHCFVS